jgi:hypothetical protein
VATTGWSNFASSDWEHAFLSPGLLAVEGISGNWLLGSSNIERIDVSSGGGHDQASCYDSLRDVACH